MTPIEANAGGRGRRRADRFLLRVAVFAAIYSVAGFALRAALDHRQLERFTLPVIVHAILMTAWLVLFVAQIGLRQSGRTALHMRLGRLAAGLVAGIVGVGVVISFTASRDFESPPFFVLNALFFLLFGLMFALGVRAAAVRDFPSHKRYMLVATTLFLGPPTARYLAIVGAPAMLAPLAILVAAIGIPARYDRLDRGRWHRASRTGAGLVVATMVLVLTIAASPLIEWLAPLYER